MTLDLGGGRRASVQLDDFEVRVVPDGASDVVPQKSKVILEIKCPHSKNMRNQAGTRMQLHARQCLLELLAYPEAACLLFAVLNYMPGAALSTRNYDSVLHRLDRASAMEALAEICARGLACVCMRAPRLEALLALRMG